MSGIHFARLLSYYRVSDIEFGKARGKFSGKAYGRERRAITEATIFIWKSVSLKISFVGSFAVSSLCVDDALWPFGG